MNESKEKLILNSLLKPEKEIRIAKIAKSIAEELNNSGFSIPIDIVYDTALIMNLGQKQISYIYKKNYDWDKHPKAKELNKKHGEFSVKKAEALGIELTNLQKEVIEKHSKGDYPYMLGLILKTAEICESALKKRKYNNQFQKPAKTWEEVEKILKEDPKISPRIFPYAKKVIEPLLTKKQQD